MADLQAMGLTELNQRMAQRNEEHASLIVGELKAAREALDAHYRAFITYLNAVQELQPEDSISDTALYYNQDLQKIEIQIAQSKRKGTKEEEEQDDSQDGEVTPVKPE